jgi:hypothetical protein
MIRPGTSRSPRPTWDAGRAYDAIGSIVDDVLDHLDPARGWPPHPHEGRDGMQGLDVLDRTD